MKDEKLLERNQKIAEHFKKIKDIAETYLSRSYPDAPDPEIYMQSIQDEVNAYDDLIKEEVS